MSASNSVTDILQAGARTLLHHSESPRLDAELLLGKVLGLSRAALVAHDNDPVTDKCERSYAGLIEQRMRGAPVAYLTGIREFWSLPLTVTPDVLVPRPETEVLVELALRLLPEREDCSILDLGTGSGAVALAIASERPRAQITAVDISPPALGVATRNATSLGLSRIQWRLGSWFDAVPGERFDMIVANPPYVAAHDPALAMLSAEPTIALCPGATGLEALRAIAASAPLHLHECGWLLLEHGRDQAADVADLLGRHGFEAVCSHPDFSGRPRVTLGTLHTQHSQH